MVNDDLRMLDAHADVMRVKLCKANTRGVTEVEVLQEGLAGATMIGIDNDSSIISQVNLYCKFQHASFYFAHQAKRNEPF